jgi:hypothetical protein
MWRDKAIESPFLLDEARATRGPYIRNFARILGQDPGNLYNIFESILFYTANIEEIYDVAKILAQDPGQPLCRSPYSTAKNLDQDRI